MVKGAPRARFLREAISPSGCLLVGFLAVGFVIPLSAACAQTVPLRDQVAPRVRGLEPTTEADPSRVLPLEIRTARDPIFIAPPKRTRATTARITDEFFPAVSQVAQRV